MRLRWNYIKWKLRIYRPKIVRNACVGIMIMFLIQNREAVGTMVYQWYLDYGVLAANEILQMWYAVGQESYEKRFQEQESLPATVAHGRDPAYERLTANAWLRKIQEENEMAAGIAKEGEETLEDAIGLAAEASSWKAKAYSDFIQQMVDQTQVIRNFYTVHPTTTAGEDMIQVERFLSMDLSLTQNHSAEAGDLQAPQILIYHTHSQETYTDYPENSEATVVGVGAYLAELLEAKGYRVIHDRTVYDMREGSLDRSDAYTYALEGITGILQANPSIEVVLDLHRDGVEEGTHLVTDVEGVPTAKIMFFNGTSQTPDGPIEYLPNPNREANLAFSFQMQLLAAERYPGLTRKIYLKGLRYNQHVRARSALIEVGAQTNTYAEAVNAMGPLSELLAAVLGGI